VSAEPTAGRRRHDGDRDQNRERDRDRNRQRQVGEQLSLDVLEKQHGQEHGNGSCRRREQRRHDLACAVVCGLFDRHAAFLEANDVAGNDDGAFDDHADSEGKTRQRDDVDAATREVEHTERRQQADRNRARDQHRRAGIAHEPPHAEECEQGANYQILDQQAHGAVDEQRCIERLFDAEAALLERPFAQLRDDLFHLLERAEHVRTRRTHDAQPDRRVAVLIREELPLRRPHLDSREVRESHGLTVAPREHELPEVLSVIAPGVAQ
jgi:hypothetical protein